jgi:hypothetical protein
MMDEPVRIFALTLKIISYRKEQYVVADPLEVHL